MYLTFQKTLGGGQPITDYITVNMDTVRTLEAEAPVLRQAGSAYRVYLHLGGSDAVRVYLASAELGAQVAEDRMAELRRMLSVGEGYVNWSAADDGAPTMA